MAHKVVTANRLRDGEVVYLTAAGEWTERLDGAGPAGTAEREAALLAVAERAVAARFVVDPYAMPVDAADGVLRPLSQREIIRAKGPSVRPDLGKQTVQEI